MVLREKAVLPGSHAGASSGGGGSFSFWIERAGRWTLLLWLGSLGSMLGPGNIIRVVRGEIRLQASAPMIGIGLLLLAAAMAALWGRFLLAGLISAIFVSGTIGSLLLGPKLTGVGMKFSPWSVMIQVALPLAALAWILTRKIPASRGGRAYAGGAGILLVAAFLIQIPAMAAGLGQAVGMLIVPPAAPMKVSQGEILPDVQIKTVDGEWIKPDEPGVVYVINFWATWCVPCRHELPQLLNLDRELRDVGGARVMAVNTEELSADALRDFVRKEGLDGLPVFTIRDSDKALLGVETIPMTLVVRDRKILVRSEGVGPNTIEDLKSVVLASLGKGEASP